ncbi:MAG: flagellar hook-associated protein FlgK [Chromatiaceae bacterium]|nr:flagellar hook-associated protein FlgK [Gammaproteobacteria bacterium]MCP5301036.1 flagellar hook-associated protein FlgK [Chromatiaceae bacterium]MCP5421492.1 flagellar hook-associated protein FlgK [Chromatiaceae bacterium]
MASIINTGISALNAFKRQLETTGHNIANVNTEGYSRQSVQFETRPPQSTAQGQIGSGVDVASIYRNYDQLLATRVRDYTSSFEDYSVYQQRASQIDNVVADASAGLDDIMQQFFAAVNDVADDPTSIAARSVMLNRATQLTDRFNALNAWFEDIRNQVNREFVNDVDEINSIAQSIAQVNARIGTFNGAVGGIPNDILDERDKLIDDLSHHVNVTTLQQSDGSMNVFIGTGQALVVGGDYNRLAVINNSQAADHKDIVIQQTGGLTVNVTTQLTGGSLGGLLRFRNEILDQSQNGLGRIAIGIASFFNDEHRSGMDLDGDLGGDFFQVASPEVLASPTNAGTVTVAFDDPADLSTHEYRLDYDGANWALTDLETGGSVALSGAGTIASPFVAEGMSIVIGAGAAAGDSYWLRPTRTGASDLALLVNHERDIAAADPVRASATAGNSGTGVISTGALTSRSGNTKLGAMAPPGVTLTYLAGSQLDLSAAPAGATFVDANGNAVASPIAYASGQTVRVSIPNLGVYELVLTGTPGVGDTFTLADNTGGVGDNRNARRLADLQNTNLMIGGTASFADTYGALIADVGTKTHQAENNAMVQEHLLGQAEAAKSEVSGVNLDEEAADLVRFQQAYQAAAQVISVANSLFDSLLSAVRR